MVAVDGQAPDAPFTSLECPDETATRQLAADIALALRPGDLLCLSGDLGAGKSTFARALIRAFAGDPELEVPSPTFTLVQTYALERMDLSHFDLYRLEEPEELEELGLDELMETGAALIEWPEKAGGLLPEGALRIAISQPDDTPDLRRFTFATNDPALRQRVLETLAARDFLEASGMGGAPRWFLAGDASLRRFEAVTASGCDAVLMHWPFQGDAVAKEVRAYMRRVHLAEDCRAVVAIGSELRRQGFLAPEILSADMERGLVLLRDLGRQTIAPDGVAIADRYLAAVEVLAAMHALDWPAEVSLQNGDVYEVPAYSADALVAEASLFLDWFVPEKTGAPADAATRAGFETLWRAALDGIADARIGWVLRDYHSPNLLWQDGAEGTGRIGLIDFQDTVRGPVAYDVASLLFDARVDIAPELESGLFDAYVRRREETMPDFDRTAFERAYAVMAAQRISKILGIFVRLARRDHKPAYLSHLPRMLGYLERALESPVLADLKDWYARHLP